MAAADVNSLRSCSQTSIYITREASWGVSIPIPSGYPGIEADSAKNFNDVDLAYNYNNVHPHGVDAWGTLENMSALGLDLQNDDDAYKDGASATEWHSFSDDRPSHADHLEQKQKPFQKWMKTLQRRALHRRRVLTHDAALQRPPSSHHRKSSSGSSFGFVTHVRSASISLASVSMMSRSRWNTAPSHNAYSRASRSSRASVSAARVSEDGGVGEKGLDPEVIERALQRRRILEELIATEEGYIRDVRFLMNVYITILAALPTLPMGLRSSINRNLAEIVELHEEILGDLHRVVPDSEYTQTDLPSHIGAPGSSKQVHKRWRSLDAVPEDKGGMSWLHEAPGTTAEPQVAADVARIFSQKMSRFFIYEEYGAKYESMIKDVASAHRSMPLWDTYQKGLEVLAASLGPEVNSQGDKSKKSLTIGDLLVKPIQRVCKYPLLFAELLKYTPVCDCPYSHMEIDDTLVRLREATAEINRATNDTRVKAVLEKTWVLQDRLAFPNQSIDAVSKNRIRSFGQVQLCGALHVCWQTKEGVSGQYMIVILYREWLCLATASRADQIYTIQACIGLNSVKVEDADNGRGLQCHTAPFSWKLVFESDHQLYELLMTACTPKEEAEWRNHLNPPAGTSQDPSRTSPFSFLTLNIKSLGTVFGKPGTIARRISIHRATTVGPKSPLCQVILKHTSVTKDPPRPSSGSQINRSQSLLTTHGRLPVLAPPRGDRARLEAILADVWTRDILPFPGITARARSEHMVRSSAQSMIRKLSVASIASSFAKRSPSLTSVNKAGTDDSSGELTDFLRVTSRIIDDTTAKETAYDSSKESLRGQELSVIADEPERSPTATDATGSAQSEWGEDVLRTVHHLDSARVASDAHIGGALPEPAVLRPSSSNSARLSRPSSAAPSKATTDYSIEMEHAIKMQIPALGGGGLPPSAIQQHQMSAKPWAPKAGTGARRDILVQGIRSFFR